MDGRVSMMKRVFLAAIFATSTGLAKAQPHPVADWYHPIPERIAANAVPVDHFKDIALVIADPFTNETRDAIRAVIEGKIGWPY